MKRTLKRTLSNQQQPPPRQKIAVVGGGIAGLLVARLLATQHQIQLYESSAVLGGNARSFPWNHDGTQRNIDLGVNVFHRHAYPRFFELMTILGIESRPCDLSIEILGDGRPPIAFDFNRQRFLGKSFWTNALALRRLRKELHSLLAVIQSARSQASVSEVLAEGNMSWEFERNMLVLASGVWTMRASDTADFPAGFVFRHLESLDMLLQSRHASPWHFVPDGVHAYLSKLQAPLADQILFNTSVTSIRRTSQGVAVESPNQPTTLYDQVVLATPGPVSFRLLANPTQDESAILSQLQSMTHPISLGYSPSRISAKRQSASISIETRGVTRHELHIPRAHTDLHQLTKGLLPKGLLLVHSDDPLDRRNSLVDWTGETPVFSRAAVAASQQLPVINGKNRIHYCGSHWGNGLHEAAIESALQVAKSFQIDLNCLKVSRI